MTFRVTTTWHNASLHTIYARLQERLGREPTTAEICTEVHRILDEAKAARSA